MLRRLWPVLLTLALAAATAAGAPARPSGSTLNLVVYSTPASAYGKLIAAFQKTGDSAGTANWS